MAEEWVAEQSFSMIDQFTKTVLSNVALRGGIDATFELPIEVISYLLYETEVRDSGFMLSLNHATVVKSNADQLARIDIANAVSLARIDGTEEAGRLKWRWIPGTGYSTDDGFFEITFYYCGKFNGNLIAELLDNTDIVRWSSGQFGGWISGSVYDKCGQDVLDPATRLVDGDILTEWRHSVAEQHWIILDMGASYAYPSFKTYVDAGANSMRLTIYASDNPAVWGTPVIQDWGINPGWNIITLTSAQGRYLKIVNSVGGDQNLNKWMEFKAKATSKVVLAMKSLTWEFKLRVNANTISGPDWFAEISNVSVKKYKKSGSAELTLPIQVEDLISYQSIIMAGTLNPGTQIKFHMDFSNNGLTWAGFTGPDKTPNTYYLTANSISPPVGYEAAPYYKWKAFLTGDGRETPVLDSILVKELVKITRGSVALEYSSAPAASASPTMGGNGHIPVNSFDRFSRDQSHFVSGNKEISYLYQVLPAWTLVTPSMNPAIGGNTDIPISRVSWAGFALLPLTSGFIHYNKIYPVLPAVTTVIPSINPALGGNIDIPISRVSWAGFALLPLTSGFIHYNKIYPVLPAMTTVIPSINPALGGNIDIPLMLSNIRGNIIPSADGTTHTTHYPKFILLSSGWVSRLGSQVLSGYITEENGTPFIHPEGMTLIVFSEDGSDIRTNAYLDATTGFYQIILGLFKYPSRNLVAKQTTKDWDIAFRGFPSGDVLDATKLVPDRNLAFTLVEIGKEQCPRAVAFVDSLVSY